MILHLNCTYLLVRNTVAYSILFMLLTIYIILGSKFFKKMLKDVSIPVSYLTFQGIISNKVVRIEKGKDKGPPILTWDDILKLVMYVAMYFIRSTSNLYPIDKGACNSINSEIQTWLPCTIISKL